MECMQSNRGKLMFVLLVVIIAFIGYRSSNKTMTKPLEAQATVSNISKEAIEPIIREYILNHPEVIMESVEIMQKNKTEDMVKQIQANIMSKRAEIESVVDSPYAGNKDGRAVVVMFYDYNCNYCKKANEVINQLIDADKNVKVIYKPMPILGANSEYLSKLMLSIYKTSPENFKVVHDNVMGLKQINKSDIEGVIAKNGLDLAKLEIEIASPEVIALQNKVMELARMININGAPVFIINGQFHQGLMDLDSMKGLLAQPAVVVEQPAASPAS